jgi:hypothetical protein
MTFQKLLTDVIKHLAAFSATEDVQHISAARQAMVKHAPTYGTWREYQALWDVTICLQRQIQIGADA